LIVFNKADLLDPEHAENIARRYDGVAVSATQRESLRALVARMRHLVKTKNEEADQLAAGE
jgi:50S ribosomal subunit-associated GTPase HflX